MHTPRFNETQIAVVKRARLLGYANHDIAAYYGANQGRVAEVNTGQVGASVRPADALPDDFPPPSARARPSRRGDHGQLSLL